MLSILLLMFSSGLNSTPEYIKVPYGLQDPNSNLEWESPILVTDQKISFENPVLKEVIFLTQKLPTKSP